MIKETWYLLYGGSSPDGRGQAQYIGRTTNKHLAKKHFNECKKNPYSIGYVEIVTDGYILRATNTTKWD